MALQVQQEQLPIHLSGRRGSGFALWLAARELNLLAVDGYVLKVVISWSNFGNQLSFVWVFPSLISVEINMKKSNGFSLELSTDPVIFAETALKGLFHTVPCFTSQMSWKLKLLQPAEVDCTLLGSPSFISRVLVGALRVVDWWNTEPMAKPFNNFSGLV